MIQKYMLVLLIVLLSTTSCDLLESEDADSTNIERIVYGLTLNPSGIDPHINASSELGIPLMSVYDTLVYRHPQTFLYEAGLAERWEILNNGTRYRFFLKRNVTFHDGQPFNADAVGVNLDRIMAESTASQKARGLLGPFYQGYNIVNEFTVEIILSNPYEPLLDSLSQVYLGMASPLALANHQDGTYQWHQVGTGPYMVKEVVPGDRIVLEKNPDYAWGPPFYTVDNPNPLDEIEFRFYTDPATRDDALQAGEVDFIGELLPVDAELLSGNSNIRLYPTPIPGQPLQFLFNTQRFPTDNANIRRALLHATNRTAIVDAIFAGLSPVAYGPLTSTTPGYNPEVENFYPFDLQQTLDLLERANIIDSDEDGLLDQLGEPITITILAPPWGLIPETAQAIQGQWRSIGITVNIEQVPNFPTLLERIDAGEYHMVALYSFGLDASVLNSYYLSNGFDNVSGFANEEIDNFLSQALQEPDPTARDNIYGLVQTRIMEEAIILPIREYVNLNASTNQFDGVIFDAHGWWPLLNNFQIIE